MARIVAIVVFLVMSSAMDISSARIYESIMPESVSAEVNNQDAANTLDNNPREFVVPSYWQAAASIRACITYDLGESPPTVGGFRESSGPFPGNPFTLYIGTELNDLSQVFTNQYLVLTRGTYRNRAFTPRPVRYFRLCIERTDETGYGELAHFRALQQQTTLDTPLKVMPLGDSLTLGYGAKPGYRQSLYDTLRSECHVEFIGEQGSDPIKHEGMTGRTNTDICWDNELAAGDANPPCENPLSVPRVPPQTTLPVGSREAWRSLSPDVIVLLAGTNDFLRRMGEPETRLAQLTNAILEDLPEVELFVASIPFMGAESRFLKVDPTHPRPDQCSLDRAVKAYNEVIRDLGNADEDDRLHYVTLNEVITQKFYSCADVPFSAFDTVSPTDLVHPVAVGYEVMANEWFESLRYLCNAVAGDESPPWMTFYKKTGLASSNLSLLRLYRDQILASTKTGRSFVASLYSHTDDILRALLENPELAIDAGRLLYANLPSVQKVVSGETVALHEVENIIAFLSALEQQLGPASARWVSSVTVQLHRTIREGNRFLGFVVR